MTTREAGEKWGVAECTVADWIRAGLIPGAYKAMLKGHERWMLPDDATCPRYVMRADTKEEYILKYSGTLSIKSIAANLGISTAEVRSIFDRLDVEL